MAVGLAFWSSMTALGGAATNFATLSAARIGVGAGEAAAIPCAHSLLSEYFPARNRATVLATYISGTFLGSAAALIFGGWFILQWPHICTGLPFTNACSLSSWKAALIAAGLPGLPLAVLIAGLREPAKQQRRGAPAGQLLLAEFAAAIPPFTLLMLYRGGGLAALRRSLMLIVWLTLAALLLIYLTGDIAQWAAIALGAYAIIAWGQIQKIRDTTLYRRTFGCPTFVLAMLSSGAVACISGGVQAWAAAYAMRTFELTSAQTGIAVGLTLAVSCAVGVLTGGRIADSWKQVDRRAPVWVALICLIGGLPTETCMLLATNSQQYLIALAAYSVLTAGWAGAYGALVQDLVLPRMRGTAASVFALVTIVIASGAGPYWVGKVSTLTSSLGRGLISVQLMLPVAAVLLFLTARRLSSPTQAQPMEELERAL